MALKVIQANVEHSAASQDLLLQHLAEWAADVAILSEPYYVPPGRSDWAVDSAGLVAIKFAGGLPFTLHAQGDGYVVVKHGQMLLAGVYCPPNDGIAALEASLNRLSADLQRSTLPALVAGDFNAKSTAWGARLTDRRGEKLLEWATSHGLTILNRGTTPTCVRPQGSSRVDITGEVEVDEEAEWFREALTHVCDASMPRSGALPPRRHVYWWSERIAELRRACIAARRASSRHLRRRRRDPDLDAPLHEAYRTAKKDLRVAIAHRPLEGTLCSPPAASLKDPGCTRCGGTDTPTRGRNAACVFPRVVACTEEGAALPSSKPGGALSSVGRSWERVCGGIALAFTHALAPTTAPEDTVRFLVGWSPT
ncbi:hypothetical protein ABMA27_015047 [Loxostege sticticalis]|uniref:Endonuclease/exonuclease/phosphatase domain-containing protein n=1 Tax=Loxostege sticticalis TaxID=481309 RepID=A0ABR3I686_LOXSC